MENPQPRKGVWGKFLETTYKSVHFGTFWGRVDTLDPEFFNGGDRPFAPGWTRLSIHSFIQQLLGMPSFKRLNV